MSDTPKLRPGVSNAYLAASGVRRVPPAEAKTLCGLAESGLWIPYRERGGAPVVRENEGPQGFGRLRLDRPFRDGRKYHQRAKSKPYLYIPHNLHLLTMATDLVVVEGEFKAMSLAEAGIAAVGVGGINLALHENDFVPGLRDVLNAMPVQRVLFLGDGDTSLIFDFSREAVKLARALAGLSDPVTVALPRIGLGGPGKGIDDVREALGSEAFADYWAALVADAEKVPKEIGEGDLAARLFLRESREALKEGLL